MSAAIEELVHDHEAILFGLGILDTMAGLAREGRPLAASEARELVGFLKEFADTCHHGKEEGLLFPALVKAGLPKEGGPVSVMLKEHDIGRAHWRSMDEALRAPGDMTAFAVAASEYSAFLRQHIEKENTVLFPMGDRLLDAGELARIASGFKEHEERVMGTGRHEELHAMLGAFGKKYVKA
ncbi:MAG: hemerythrin domain-containing protein [Spirochaetota bacterium]